MRGLIFLLVLVIGGTALAAEEKKNTSAGAKAHVRTYFEKGMLRALARGRAIPESSNMVSTAPKSWLHQLGIVSIQAKPLLVAEVKSGSLVSEFAPECGGLKIGDVIRRIGSKLVHSIEEFETTMAAYAGATAELLIERRGQFLVLNLPKFSPCQNQEGICTSSETRAPAANTQCIDVEGRELIQ